MAQVRAIFKGGLQFFKNGISFKGNASVASGSGAPTNGTSGTLAGKAAKGSLYLDYTNGAEYMNTGTQASPTWTLIAGAGTGSPVSPAQQQTQPADPAGTASTAAMVMMGLAGSITPAQNGRILIALSGDVAQTTTADGAKWQLSYGTGAAPANGAALAGTQVGSNPTMTFLTGVLLVPFSSQAIVTGLTVGTAYWLDVALAAITGGTASVSKLSLSAHEF